MENDVVSTGSQHFVGWGTPALINSVLAQGKGRSGLLWFFISIFIGPIATLVIAMLETRKNDPT